MNIDANKVIEKLLQKISQLELDKSILEVRVEELSKEKEGD